ncbi:phosphatidylserine decarboxylase family protein [Desulfovibrio inopinatus]|uniref:phosphatidylserine decarboxylase family protein n=1 Tax=Desulfovibrio inopinatus TaxID=102109 RepID=UPI001B7FE9FA|nr:phosphatidylserine decarboxylase family protein [Desulfovibrio inopinatus]
MAGAILASLVRPSVLPFEVDAPVKSAPYQVGKWLASDQQILDAWADELILEAKVEEARPPLAPVLQEFKELIENDPELYMLFTEMFLQVPHTPEFAQDPTGGPKIRDYQHMLELMNVILTRAPEFNTTGLVGFPLNAILNWAMGTQAGTAAFLNQKVNQQLKKILNEWAKFLESPESRYVLTEDPEHGWFGRDAQQAMPTFVEDFVCDPTAPYYGYASWDDFFTRTLREDQRPVAAPEDDTVIANACESAPYRLETKVNFCDTFWLKGQPYSLAHMFDGDPMAKQFVGGTVYQAFLSALSYHRWHSPVSGTVVQTKLIEGSYYAQAQCEGFDPAGPNLSQGYITHLAARALVCIEADNPDIGLMCVLFIGMAEVSSNEITVVEGQHVKKGEQLGMFHYGGSTHVLLFRPGVELEFDLHGQEPDVHSHNILVRERIATVKNGRDTGKHIPVD